MILAPIKGNHRINRDDTLMTESTTVVAMASPSVAEIRARLSSLEAERDVVQKKKALEEQRLQWIETRQQQQARLAQLVRTIPPTDALTASPELQAEEAEPGNTVVKTQSKREVMGQLREQALQVLKKQKEAAIRISDQLRSLREKERPAAVSVGGSSPVETPTASPSPPKTSSSPAAFPTRRSNKLVLVPTSSSVLGKRHAPHSSPSAVQTPSVNYPALAAAEDVVCETPAQLASLAFRIATRHFLQSGKKCALGQLKEILAACTSEAVTDDVVLALVRSQAQVLRLVIDGYDTEAASSGDEKSLKSGPTSAARIVATSEVKSLIEAEKQALDEMVASWTDSSSPSAPRTVRLVGAMNAIQATSILGDSSREESITSLEQLLASCFGVERHRDVVETAYPHLSRVWKAAKTLLDSSDSSDAITRLSSSFMASSTIFGRTFDLEQSVMKQTQRNKRRRRSKRADPMKVLCMYELSGVCNDSNCPYQHQRDFEGDDGSDEVEEADEEDAEKEDSLIAATTRISLNQFMQLRQDLSKWWPSPKNILEQSEVEAQPPDRQQARKAKAPTTKESTPDRNDDIDGLASNHDFLELGSSSSDESGDDQDEIQGRYCADNGNDVDMDDAFSELQQHIATNPEDADAWLLLALRCLKLDVSLSDDQARLSTSSILIGELEAFHALLCSSPSNPSVVISQDNVVQSLYVLSRALEVEANAYCGELWLVHLRLSQLLANQRDVDSQQETTEQALGFLPNSVELWRHLLKLQLPNLDSLEDATTIYLGQLQIIAAASQQAKEQDVKDAFSVLLCDVVIQLTALQCCAGRPDEALSFLWALVGGNGQDGEELTQWHTDVRDQMIGDDLLILYGVHVHIALFSTVPLWLRQRAFDDSISINAFRLLLPLDHGAGGISCENRQEGKRICEAAFKAFGDPDFVPPGLEVLRHNWVVILAHDTSISADTRMDMIAKYIADARQWKTFLPRVWTVLASVFRDIFDKRDTADELIEELMKNYRENSSAGYERFGEALHHYLLHRPSLFSAHDSLGRTQFPNLPFLVGRLIAMLPTNDPVYSRRAIKRILQEGDTKTQQEALRMAFHALIRATLDYVVKCQLGEGDNQATDEQDITQDTYYLVAQAQLLSQICGPQEGIDALELFVLQGGSSKWSVLPRECRRLVWSTRFQLQCELLKTQPTDVNPSRELFPLFKRYVLDVGPLADSDWVVKRQLREYLSEFARKEGSTPPIREVIATCMKYSTSESATTSTLDMELFRLCLHSVPTHERPNQFAAFQPHLIGHPHFLLEYLDASIQDSDRRRVRNTLRHKALQQLTPFDASSLRTLTLLDVKDKNVHGLTQILRHRIKVDPLDRIAWELLHKLEISFGGRQGSRAKEFAAALAKTKGVQVHTKQRLSGQPNSKMPHALCIEWKQSGAALTRLPPIYSLSVSLQVLDLSHNLLVSVPGAVYQLTQLQQLNLTGNALVSLPASIGQLSKLKAISLAHNNLAEIPNAFWDGLLQLREVDLRFNALSGVSPRVLRLMDLKTLLVRGNNFTWETLLTISTKLPAGTVVDIRPDDVPDLPTASPKDVAIVGGGDQTSTADQAGEKHAETEAVSPHSDERQSKDDEDMIDLSDDKNDDGAMPTSEPKTNDAVEVVVVDEDVEMVERAPETSTIDIDVPTTPERSTSPQIAGSTRKSSAEGSASDDEVEFLGSSPSKTLPVSVPGLVASSQTIGHVQSPSPSIDSHPSQQVAAGYTRQPLDRSSAEWRKEVERMLNRTSGQLRKCTLCLAEDTVGSHQRFNGIALCMLCLREACSVAWEHHTAATKPT